MLFEPKFVSQALDQITDLSPLCQVLVSYGVIDRDDAAQIEAISASNGLPLTDILVSNCDVTPFDIARAKATVHRTQLIDPTQRPADDSLVDKFGASRAIKLGLLPWRMMGSTVIALTDTPETFARMRQELTETFGAVRMAITTREWLETCVQASHAAQLSQEAEIQVPEIQSCRAWRADYSMMVGLVVLATLIAGLTLHPSFTLASLSILAVAVLILNSTIKVIAAILALLGSKPAPPPAMALSQLPRLSLLVPLYRETEIAAHLLARLKLLDYPRELLDVCLITECDDTTTRRALGQTVLPTWMRPIVVPKGTLRTKPRALNYALNFAKGSIIGVYDAEDAPAPDQLRIVANHFENAGADVACLQGILDYYNDRANWLTRCFTIEYASWFRVVLPGLERLGLVVPLGGTTLFFRRNILEQLGGWDAHNVTEDADLGVRLARAGYRTEFIPSVTQEEANGRFWPWVKQRSRWLKGYAITYAVHMRNPLKLWKDLGTKRFIGIQLLFAGTLLQFVLAPVFWSFWVVPFGIQHPFFALLSAPLYWTCIGVFFATELINFAVAAIALRAAGKSWLLKWALTLQLYFPLASVAAYKGLLELAWKPFFWDKTTHGVLLPNSTIENGAIPRPARLVSDG